jgi:hypothetical protein
MVWSHKYCGIFTPCKNCDVETRSRGYATVDEAVFSLSRTMTSRASHCLTSFVAGNSYKHLDDARVGKVHMTTSTVMQQLKHFCMSD